MPSWNESTIARFRAQNGKGIAPWGDHLLLLHTRGAKTGRPKVDPVVFHMDGGRYVIAASKGGAPTHPAWYHNLRRHREAEVELGTGRGIERFTVRATPVPRGPERDRLYDEHGNVFAAFRDHPAKTKRIIPVVVLERV